MKKNELIKILKQIEINRQENDDDCLYSEYIYKKRNNESFVEPIFSNKNISISIIDGRDIEEREDFTYTVHVWLVLKVSFNNEITYWKLLGDFSSYAGKEWYIEEIIQVKIKQITINTYESI